MSSYNKYILVIDQGTTSTRSILYNNKLIPIAIEKIKIKQYFPQQGWSEQNPEEIWKSVLKTIKNIIKKNNIRNGEILSLGITNQRETSIIWNKLTGKAIYKAIVWEDKRTSNYCNKIKTKKLEKTVQKITGLTIDPYFSATKIKWILKNVKKTKTLLKKNQILFGTIDSWILWKLTKGRSHFTDVTNASRTMLYDIEKKEWSSDLLKLFNIPKQILPEVKSNIYNYGTSKILGCELKINSLIGDQQASLIGQSCLNKGMIKSTFGTGSFILMNIGNKIQYSKNKLLTSIAYEIKNKTFYCFEGSIFSAGSAIEWLVDGIKIIDSSKQTANLYKKANKNQSLYFVPTFNGIGAPYWKPEIRAAIYGINRNTGIADIVKATLQSICLQTKDLINLMQQDSLIKITSIKVDGGMINNNPFMQFLSDILNIEIMKPKYLESTAMGAAYLSAIGSDLIEFKDIKKKWKKNKNFKPKISIKKRNEIYKNWKNAIKKTLLEL